MTRRFTATLVGLGLLIAITPTTGCIRTSTPRAITFAECEEIGGVAWQVDLFDPDICPACAEYRACEIEYNDYRDVCPECYGPCQECQDRYSLHELCPECYGPCQECQNEYHNEFTSEEQRYELCPECRKCADCRDQLQRDVASCPPCISCNQCKEENKRYSDLREVCPQGAPCTECMERSGPYPDRCPNGQNKIAEISDAATWFQCCR